MCNNKNYNLAISFTLLYQENTNLCKRPTVDGIHPGAERFQDNLDDLAGQVLGTLEYKTIMIIQIAHFQNT